MRFTLPLLVSLLSPFVAAQRSAPGTIVAGDFGRRLDAVVTDKAVNYWGAVLVAVAGKPVLAKGYGLADRSKIPNGPASLFDLGGTSQQLTAILVLRLCAEKKLRLDDPLHKHLPGWPADKAAITVEHLLRHTSGLPGEAVWAGGAAGAVRTAIEAIGRTKLIDVPGGKAHYTSLNANLQALVVESVLQGRFDKILTERMQKAFGMSSAGPSNGRFDSKLVTARRSPENERGEPATAFDLNWCHRGARAVLASVTDVHALLAVLAEGKLLDEAQLEMLWRPVAGGESYSVSVAEFGAERLVRIAGQAAGYRWCWLMHRASRTWVVLATEDFGSTAEIEAALLAELAQNQVSAQAPAKPVAQSNDPQPATPGTTAGTPGTGATSVDASNLERFVGTFAMPGGGGSLRIERDGDALRLHGSGLQASLRVTDGVWADRQEARARRAEDRGLAIAGLLLRGDEAAVAGGFLTAEQAREAIHLVAAWRTPDGPLPRIEFVGTQFDGKGQAAHSWFRLHGQGGEFVFCAAWPDEQHFGACTAPAGPPPFSVELQVVRGDCAVARTIAGGDLRLTIEGRGSARVLVFEDGTPGPPGLLDCPLLGNPPR